MIIRPPHFCAIIWVFLNKIKLFQESLCNAMSHVVLFPYPIKLNISRQGTESQKLLKRSYIVISSDLWNATKKILDKFSFHRYFNYSLQPVRYNVNFFFSKSQNNALQCTLQFNCHSLWYTKFTLVHLNPSKVNKTCSSTLFLLYDITGPVKAYSFLVFFVIHAF